MYYREEDGGIRVSGTGPVDLCSIFENGQCFRFEKEPDGSYSGVALRRFLRVSAGSDSLFLYPCSKEDFEKVWRSYFDFDTDYAHLFESPDDLLTEGMRRAPGLRVLRQEPFETLISFIISANNNIGRIRGIIRRLCDRYGDAIEGPCGICRCFPEPEVLADASVEDLTSVGTGYRAPYIKETAEAVRSGFSLESLKTMDYREAKETLLRLKGVGPKVADCILLFSLGHRRAFPADVWIKRVLKEHYGFTGSDRATEDFAYSLFGDAAGIAQQYIFYAARGGENTGDKNGA